MSTLSFTLKNEKIRHIYNGVSLNILQGKKMSHPSYLSNLYRMHLPHTLRY